jgi:hypothetical protein
MNVHPGVSQILSIVPTRPMGRPHPNQEQAYQQWLRDWANGILRLDKRIGFKVSSRGWCYLLEEYGLSKGDFDDAEKAINICRKAGYLPLDICAEDVRRLARGLEDIDAADHEDYAASIFAGVDLCHESYVPFSFWDDKKFYIEMVVEKIDLVSLFMPVCRRFRIPIKNPECRLERYQLARSHNEKVLVSRGCRAPVHTPLLRRFRSCRAAHIEVAPR